jgi:16S rRNA (guanine527-N7)-methyltransferase
MTASPWPVHLSPTQIERLTQYETLLRDRGSDLGLVSRRDVERIHERHILDSLRATEAFGPHDGLAFDLGSGAGLPGIVLALALPGCRFVLIESHRRRAGWLELVIDRVGISNAAVYVGRAEALAAGLADTGSPAHDSPASRPADVITARAFAVIDRTWAVSIPLMRSGGKLVYFAGSEESVRTARQASAPERPARVDVLQPLAKGPALVIMTRG